MAVLAFHAATATLQVGVFINSTAKITSFTTFDSMLVNEWLASMDLAKTIKVIVSSGLAPGPIAPGTYHLSQDFFEPILGNKHLKVVQSIATELGLPAHLIDPLSPIEPITLVTGSPKIQRSYRCSNFIFNFLVRKEVQHHKDLSCSGNFIVAHLDEEIELGAISQGQLVDVVTSGDGGPFAWKQAGGLPFDAVLELCESKQDRESVFKKINEYSGLSEYLALGDFQQIFDSDFEKDNLIIQALSYQVAKDMGGLATVLEGQIDGILLGGSLLKQGAFLTNLIAQIRFLGRISLYPGNQVFPSLLAGAQRVVKEDEILRFGKESG